MIVNYIIISNRLYEMEKKESNCFQKCRRSVSKSVGELSRNLVSGNCFDTANGLMKEVENFPYGNFLMIIS